MPLPGGASDKAGNSYERRWTVFVMLDLLEHKAESLRIEVPGAEGHGSEFKLVVDGVPEWHQVKRQRTKGSWSIANLGSEKVLSNWWPRILAGERCVFVSGTGADELLELTDRANRALSWEEFNNAFLSAASVKQNFDKLGEYWNGEPEAVFDGLKQVGVRTLDESVLERFVIARLASLVSDGTPELAAALLGQLADSSLHLEVTPASAWDYLKAAGFRAKGFGSDKALATKIESRLVAHQTKVCGIAPTKHKIERPEAKAVFEHLQSGRRQVLVLGPAGAGKSVVSSQVLDLAQAAGWPALVLSADDLPDASNSDELGVKLGLPESPAVCLAGLAKGRQALLVIDQLDSVGIVSGRHPERLNRIADLVIELRGFPNLHIVLVCRSFDLENDGRLRTISMAEDSVSVPVGDLDESQVRQALRSVGVTRDLPARLLRLLSLPLHLAIYTELPLENLSSLDGARSVTELYNRYWDAKRTSCQYIRGGADQWQDVIGQMVERMSSRQELHVPNSSLDALDGQVKVMASEGVISRNGHVSFHHETFFDYCFARKFVGDGGRLKDLLAGDNQGLFRRAQVRQIMVYERSADFEAYLVDLSWVMGSPDVRLHIKSLVLTLALSFEEPSLREWQVIRALALASGFPLFEQFWLGLRRNPGWFSAIDAAGDWTLWLKGGGDLRSRSIWAMSGATLRHGDRIAGLLHLMPLADWVLDRRRFLEFGQVFENAELFDMLTCAIRNGEFDDGGWSNLEILLRRAAEADPQRAVEMIDAVLDRTIGRVRADCGGLSGIRSVLPLDGSPFGRGGFGSLPAQAPKSYVELILPALLMIIEENLRGPQEADDGRLARDAVWGLHMFGSCMGLLDQLFQGATAALGELAVVDPDSASQVLSGLRSVESDSAAFLLAHGYGGNPERFAGDAVAWLCETPGALVLGYVDAPSWVSRELIESVSRWCSPGELTRLVDLLMYFTTPFETSHKGLRSRGRTELCLLNALDAERRPAAAERRLAELRRKFGINDVEPPRGMFGGVVPPPISEEPAREMSNAQWLRAISRYSSTESMEWRDGERIGDAGTQAQVLQALAKEDPERFALLLMQIPAEAPDVYVTGLLHGLANAYLKPSLIAEVCTHLRSTGGSDVNRALIYFIRSHSEGSVPAEALGAVARLAAADPSASTGPRSADGWDAELAAMNSTRGAAVLAIGNLVAHDGTRLDRFRDLLVAIAVEPDEDVRVAVLAALAPALYLDPEWALRIFRDLDVEWSTPILRSSLLDRFIQHGARSGHAASVVGVVRAMLSSPEQDLRQSGARHLTFLSFEDSSLAAEVDALFCGKGEMERSAVVGVFANNVTNLAMRDRIIGFVTAGFDDPSKTVRESAARVFYSLSSEQLEAYDSMFVAYAQSASHLDGMTSALHLLQTSQYPLPLAALSVCERFLEANRTDVGSIASGVSADAHYVVELCIRLHAQHQEPDTRVRCLDLLDELVKEGVYGIEDDLAAIER